ncbi:MAG: formimidoylglutamase [Flavobacteriales bacterium]|nr:formimidoylglutamase [Flavobacteriales bacterium]
MNSSLYKPTDPSIWTGRVDGDGPLHRRYHQVIKPVDLGGKLTPTTDPSWALLGFSSDEGVRRNKGRVGAADGPDAIRKAMASLPVHDSSLKLFDGGDITCANGDLEDAQQILSQHVAGLIRAGYRTCVLGGGHEVAYGHYTGVANALGDQSVGIINIDAHFDLRDDSGGPSSGTPFRQIREDLQSTQRPFRYLCMGIQQCSNTRFLFDRADAWGVEYVMAEDLMGQTGEMVQDKLDWFMEAVDAIYLTICLDVFSASIAPGVSAPNALGLLPRDVTPWLRNIVLSGKLVAMDVAEMNPSLDRDGITARLAGCLLDECFQVSV